jgi:glycosyltransferase involved in cell wall biosynthesis
MAAGLPVVAPAVDRLPSLLTDGREGLLYDPAAARRRWPTRW